MDAQFYNDIRTPFMVASPASVTLASTDKALYPATAFPVLGSNYFGSYPGKKIIVRAYGQITTAATPGNGTFDIYWGSGADANGTIIASSATVALSASQTNLAWMIEIDVTCRSTGTSGSVLCSGFCLFNNAVIANTLQPLLIPASAPAAVTIDTTANNVVSIQFKRSGSTAETMQVTDLFFTARN